MSAQSKWEELSGQIAEKYGLFPEIFKRQINVESGFNPNAVSRAGAQGIAQIMPATAKSWGVNPNDPQAALEAAARNQAGYLKTYLGGKDPNQVTDPGQLKAAYEKMLRAYNAGPGAVDASRKYAETNAYVQNILTPVDFNKLMQKNTQTLQQPASNQERTQPGKDMLAEYLKQNNELLSELINKKDTSSSSGYGFLNEMPDISPVSLLPQASQPVVAQKLMGQLMIPTSYV